MAEGRSTRASRISCGSRSDRREARQQHPDDARPPGDERSPRVLRSSVPRRDLAALTHGIARASIPGSPCRRPTSTGTPGPGSRRPGRRVLVMCVGSGELERRWGLVHRRAGRSRSLTVDVHEGDSDGGPGLSSALHGRRTPATTSPSRPTADARRREPWLSSTLEHASPGAPSRVACAGALALAVMVTHRRQTAHTAARRGYRTHRAVTGPRARQN